MGTDLVLLRESKVASIDLSTPSTIPTQVLRSDLSHSISCIHDPRESNSPQCTHEPSNPPPTPYPL